MKKMKLKKMCIGITDGSHNPPEGIEKSGFPMLSSKNIFDDNITLDEPRYLTEMDFEKENERTKVNSGDVLLTIVGTVGRVAVVDDMIGRITLQRSVAVLHPDKNICISRYLMYLLISKRDFFGKNARGVAQKGIYLKQLGDMEFSICDLSQQMDIVCKLDKIQKLIMMEKEQVEDYEKLIRSYFKQIFGGYFQNHINEKRLCEICSFIDYRGKTPKKSQLGVQLITDRNVKDNKFFIEPREFIPEENYNDVMSRGLPRVNDVLFTTEAPLGNVCRIPNIYEKFCVGQRLITMQPHDGVIVSEYLEYALASSEFQNKMRQKSSGSTVKGIRSKLLVLLTIPVPPIALQNQFAAFVHQVDQLKSKTQKSLDKTQLLFNSLMQQYFG